MTYTPNTGQVRNAYGAHMGDCHKVTSTALEEFDRWYAEEIRKAKQEAWDEHIKTVWGADSYEYYELSQENPYTEEA